MEKSSKFFADETEISLRKAFDKKTLFLLGIAAIALLIYLYLGNVSLFSMIEVILSAELLILILGAFFTFFAVLLDTVAWKVLLGISSIHPSTTTVYRIQLSSFSYGLLIPSAGAVEVIMRVVLGKKEFINEKENRYATSGEILSSVVAHKLCGLLAFIPISVFLAFAILAYFSNITENLTGYPLPEGLGVFFIILISFISILAVSLFVLIAKSPVTAKKILSTVLTGLSYSPLIGTYAKSTIEPSEKMIDDFSVQFNYLAKNKLISIIALLLAFLSQVAHWVSIYFILHSINIPIFIDQVAAVNFLGGTADLIPVGIPGMAGLKEITLSVFLDIGLGLGSTVAASGAILVQLVKFYFLIIVGILVYVVGKTQVASQDLVDETI